LTSVVDKEGNKTDYSYDENGLTTQIVYYRGAEAITYKYTYDENYLLTSETRPN
jgi:YD repeat-containing protein